MGWDGTDVLYNFEHSFINIPHFDQFTFWFWYLKRFSWKTRLSIVRKISQEWCLWCTFDHLQPFQFLARFSSLHQICWIWFQNLRNFNTFFHDVIFFCHCFFPAAPEKKLRGACSFLKASLLFGWRIGLTILESKLLTTLPIFCHITIQREKILKKEPKFNPKMPSSTYQWRHLSSRGLLLEGMTIPVTQLMC